MRPDVRNPLVEDYLARLRLAAARLPRAQRDDLVADLTAHLDAGAAEAGSEAEIRNLLDAVGDPDQIVAEAMPAPAVAAGSGPSGALALGLGVLALVLAGVGLLIFSIPLAIAVIALGWRARQYARSVAGSAVLATSAFVLGVIALVLPLLLWSVLSSAHSDTPEQQDQRPAEATVPLTPESSVSTTAPG